MFERELYPVVNIYFADAEYLRVELAVDRIGPLPADSRYSLHHAYNRTRRCGVAVGVEACLNGAADGLCVVPATVEQSRRDNFDIREHMAPVVPLVLVPAGVNLCKALVLTDPAVKIVDYVITERMNLDLCGTKFSDESIAFLISFSIAASAMSAEMNISP